MKTVVNVFKLTSLTIGTIIGAGFITGAEIRGFFSHGNLLLLVILAFLMFAISLSTIMLIGKKFGGFEKSNKIAFKKCSGIVKIIVLLGSVVISSAMLSAVDSVFSEHLNFPKKLPLMSVLTLVLGVVVCSRGIEGLGKFNGALVPIMLLSVITFLMFRNNFSLKGQLEGTLRGGMNIFCYIGMNSFLSCVVFLDAGKHFSKTDIVISAIVSSLLITFCIFLIKAGINTSQTPSELPLPSLFSKKKTVFYIFIMIMYFGIFTTLVSSLYPLWSFFDKSKFKACYRLLMCLFTVAVSLIGLSGIVENLYPIFGALGLGYLVLLVNNTLKQPLLSNSKFFDKSDKRIHTAGKRTEN